MSGAAGALTGPLLTWWIALCIVSGVNIAAWCVSARVVLRATSNLPDPVRAARRRLLWLSAAYVLGCGFRSLAPLVEVPRMCLHDAWIARAFLTRSAATVAELCFVAQWALVLREAAAVTGDRTGRFVAHALLPLIAVAEIFSWWAVLASTYLLHGVENALWTLAAALAVVAFACMRPRLDPTGRRLFTAAIVIGVTYVAFMVTVDVPMYFARWQVDLGAGREASSLLEGLRSAVARCEVVREWAAWRDDVPWLTLYFSLAVWISIALAHAPPLHRAASHGRNVAR